MEPSMHAVQFYDGEDFLCDAVARHLGAGSRPAPRWS
jgi:hypothetical protein